MVRCVVCYRNTDININTSASNTVPFFALCTLLSASLLAALWITRRSDCLTQGQNFEVKKCVFWYMELSLTVASLLAEEAHNNLGIFCFILSFIKLNLVCLNQKQILK